MEELQFGWTGPDETRGGMELGHRSRRSVGYLDFFGQRDIFGVFYINLFVTISSSSLYLFLFDFDFDERPLLKIGIILLWQDLFSRKR